MTKITGDNANRCARTWNKERLHQNSLFYEGKIGSAFHRLFFQSNAKYCKITRIMNNLFIYSKIYMVQHNILKKIIKGDITSCNHHKKSRYLLKKYYKKMSQMRHTLIVHKILRTHHALSLISNFLQLWPTL